MASHLLPKKVSCEIYDEPGDYIAVQEFSFAAVVHDPRVVDDALQWQALCLDFVHVDITGQLWNTHT